MSRDHPCHVTTQTVPVSERVRSKAPFKNVQWAEDPLVKGKTRRSGKVSMIPAEEASQHKKGGGMKENILAEPLFHNIDFF